MSFKFIVIFALFLVGINAQEYAVGTEIIPIKPYANLENKCTGGISGAQCSSDCSTLMICVANIPEPVFALNCSSPTQYCVDGVCSNTPSVTCTNGPSFVCTDDAIFPEPSDCTRYRVCEKGESKLYQCPVGFVFNSKMNLCQLGKTPCTIVDCSKATPAKPYIVYASDPAYYAYCLNNGGYIQTIMFKCPFEEFEVFDTTNYSCKYNCKARGYFQNPANCTQYFYCNGNAAVPTPLECSTDYVFDGIGCNKNATKCQYPPPTPDIEDPETTTISATTI